MAIVEDKLSNIIRNILAVSKKYEFIKRIVLHYKPAEDPERYT